MFDKRITALILIIIFAFNILNACNSKKNIYSNVQFNNVYKTQYIETPEGYVLNKSYFVDGKIYIFYYKEEFLYDDNGTAVNQFQNNLLYIYNITGNLLEVIDLNFDIIEDNIHYDFIPSNDGTLYIDKKISLLNITKEGKIICEISYTDVFDYIHPNFETFIFVRNIYFDTDLNCFYCLGTISDNEARIINEYGLFVLTSEGKPGDYIKIDDENIKDSVEQITKTLDGQILLKCSNPSLQGTAFKKWIYYVINMESKNITEYELPKLPDSFTNLSNISGDVYYGSNFAADYKVYYKDDYGLYGYNPDETESKLLVNWTNSDLLGQSCTVLSIIMPDVVLCELNDIYSQSRWYTKKAISLALLTRIPDDELAQKTILTIASATPTISKTLTQAVVMFNRQSVEYRIIIDDYSLYVTDDNYNRGTEFFNLDVISGVVHDMVFTSPSMPIESYINKGVFVDLYELFDSDPDISREHLLGCIMRYNEIYGNLYTIPSYFTVETLIGKPLLVGTNEALTIDEIIKLNNNLPSNATLFTNYGRDNLFNAFLQAGTNEYIDYKNAKCNFTDSSFIKMIEFVKTLPENIGNGMLHTDYADEETVEKIKNDESYLFEFNINNIESFIRLKYIYGDEDYVIKGFPNQTRNGSLITNSGFFTINGKSPNIEGAWEFIKFYLSDEIQLYQASLPITNSAISFILDNYLNKYYYTSKLYIGTMSLQILDEPIEQWRSEFYDNFSFTKADVTRIVRFLNDVSVVPKYDFTVMDIILEEIDVFFDGVITAEQCAGYIQNRVSTYLNERK